MRVILSRKGFDSSSGGHPSPVFSDGTMFSLPIPESPAPGKGIEFGSLKFPKGYQVNTRFFHLDPDIRKELWANPPENWTPTLGQSGIAAKQLKKDRIGQTDEQDLFIFFGLFQSVEFAKGRNGWIFTGKPFHAVWGWMFVDRVIEGSARIEESFPYHPHAGFPVAEGEKDDDNILYVGKIDKVCLEGKGMVPAYGTFPKISQGLWLTDGRQLESSCDKKGPWHTTTWRNFDWLSERQIGTTSSVQVPCRWQEMVLEDEKAQKALTWFQGLIA